MTTAIFAIARKLNDRVHWVVPERRLAFGAEFSGLAGAKQAMLSADVCVVGAGPAGITVCDGLLRAGASVILVESGTWTRDPDALELNYGDADGPIVKQYLTYLQDGRCRQVQGSAANWGPGWCMPFRPIDLQHRPWVPRSGWPLTPTELAPYERRACATFGIDPFPTPEHEGSLLRLSYHFPADPFLFQAMLSELVSSPALQLELGATAAGFELRGGRIESVRTVRSGGDELRVHADAVVLAAGGIENARLLLCDAGVLPANAMTGRCFMEHPHVLAGNVRFEDVTYLDAFLHTGRTLNVLALPESVQQRNGLFNASAQLRPRTNVAGTDGPVEVDLYLRTEQAPNPDSRLTLGDRLDRLGFPQPYLHWLPLEEDWTSIVRTAELVAGALEQHQGGVCQLWIRSDKPWPWDPAGPAASDNATWGNHHMGTTRMSAGPAEGVVDRDCLVHGTANLYVAGSSVFPTGSCANPTFMIVALAHRLADHLAGG